MSAFLESGRFYLGETPIFRVRFRPKADITVWFRHARGAAQVRYLTPFAQMSPSASSQVDPRAFVIFAHSEPYAPAGC